jgi:hypothetical protein
MRSIALRSEINLKLWMIWTLRWKLILLVKRKGGCKISGFHGGDYEECRLLEFDATWL